MSDWPLEEHPISEILRLLYSCTKYWCSCCRWIRLCFADPYLSDSTYCVSLLLLFYSPKRWSKGTVISFWVIGLLIDIREVLSARKWGKNSSCERPLKMGMFTINSAGRNRRCCFKLLLQVFSDFIFPYTVDGLDKASIANSDGPTAGSQTPPFKRKGKLSTIGKIFKPWKWRKKKTSDKFRETSAGMNIIALLEGKIIC